MIEGIQIRDVITEETLSLMRQSPNADYVCIKTGRGYCNFEEVRKASVRKVIRTWMRSQETDDNHRQA